MNESVNRRIVDILLNREEGMFEEIAIELVKTNPEIFLTLYDSLFWNEEPGSEVAIIGGNRVNFTVKELDEIINSSESIIPAIKKIREKTMSGLKDTKDYVDSRPRPKRWD